MVVVNLYQNKKDMCFKSWFLPVLLCIILILPSCSSNETNASSFSNNSNGLISSSLGPSVTPTQQTAPSPAPSKISAPELQTLKIQDAFKDVLLGEAEFFNIGTSESLDITRLNEAVTSTDLDVIVKQFSMVDLEHDGIPEVILWLATASGGNDQVGFEILRCQGDAVYGYTLSHREFEDLCADGTFIFAGGAFEFGVGTISFTNDSYEVDRISYREAGFDAEQNFSESYFVNHEAATAHEFEAAIDKRDKGERAAWRDLTEKNIKTFVVI